MVAGREAVILDGYYTAPMLTAALSIVAAAIRAG
jgi:hypothetical protein